MGDDFKLLNEILVAVELSTVLKTSSPGEDASNWVGAGLAALLVLTVVSSDGAVRSLGLDGLAIGADEHRGHETERAVALRNHVRLHVAVVVLARPHEATLRFEHLRNHVVDQTVLVPDLVLLELWLVFPLESRHHK